MTKKNETTQEAVSRIQRVETLKNGGQTPKDSHVGRMQRVVHKKGK
jgi:hypothetical protein